MKSIGQRTVHYDDYQDGELFEKATLQRQVWKRADGKFFVSWLGVRLEIEPRPKGEFFWRLDTATRSKPKPTVRIRTRPVQPGAKPVDKDSVPD